MNFLYKTNPDEYQCILNEPKGNITGYIYEKLKQFVTDPLPREIKFKEILGRIIQHGYLVMIQIQNWSVYHPWTSSKQLLHQVNLLKKRQIHPGHSHIHALDVQYQSNYDPYVSQSSALKERVSFSRTMLFDD